MFFCVCCFSLQAAIATLEASLQNSHEQVEKKDGLLLTAQDQVAQVSLHYY